MKSIASALIGVAAAMTLAAGCHINEPDPLTVSWARREPDQLYPPGWVSAIPDPAAVSALRGWLTSDPACAHAPIRLRVALDVDDHGRVRAVKAFSLEGLAGDAATRVEADLRRQIEGWTLKPAHGRDHDLESTLKLDIAWAPRRG